VVNLTQSHDAVFNVTVVAKHRATSQYLHYQRLTVVADFVNEATTGAEILLAELIFDQPGFVKGYSEVVIEVSMHGLSATAIVAASELYITYESHFYLWWLALERLLFSICTMLLLVWWVARLSRLPDTSNTPGTPTTEGGQSCVISSWSWLADLTRVCVCGGRL